MKFGAFSRQSEEVLAPNDGGPDYLGVLDRELLTRLIELAESP